METQLLEPTVKQKRVEVVFAQAIVDGNSETLENLLEDTGKEYKIENEKQDIVNTDKAGFINW
ncbi:MAG TPA: hypothetical protein VNX68_11620, partial [Nitrosopumilaceae archaeon]|nr:hypothetical protein [Nitrosopumilaceae archaeon]